MEWDWVYRYVVEMRFSWATHGPCGVLSAIDRPVAGMGWPPPETWGHVRGGVGWPPPQPWGHPDSCLLVWWLGWSKVRCGGPLPNQVQVWGAPLPKSGGTPRAACWYGGRVWSKVEGYNLGVALPRYSGAPWHPVGHMGGGHGHPTYF